MSLKWPSFKRRRLSRKEVVWEGRIRPTPLNEDYLVRIRYTGFGRPKVTVLEPRLVDRVDGATIPHVYPGNELCLHLPEQWCASFWIASHIIPWISLWLYHYELWHASGADWQGGGVHPESGKKQLKEKLSHVQDPLY